MANKRFIDFPIATTVGDNDIILIWQGGANKQTTKATILSGVPDSLNDLTDVTISGLTNGQILRYDSVTGQWENTDQGNLDLNDLNDVTIVSPTNGQVLVYNSSTGKWENSSGGYVPYVGAVTTVNLGAQTIQAGSFVKQGGTSSQFLKANGSVDSTAYGTGSVTSVGLTMPAAFNVANSPITTSGTLAVTGAGTVAQYIRGDGSLADFPESSGGGSSVSYYLNGSVDQGTIGGIAYKELSKVPILGAGTDFTINANGYIASFITDAGDPSLLEIPGGNWNFETYFSASSSGGTPTFYVELYKVSGTTATLIASSSSAPELIAFGTNLTPYFSTLAVPTTTLALTDRLAVRYYVTHSGRTITLHTENNHLCQIITTFTTGLTALNGLTAQVQNFAVGTTGTDFNIASATATHTFNLPTASATNRGALSSADWSLFTQAYNDKINSAAVTGTTTKTLTLTQQDGGTITASWSDLNTDAVLSVFGRTGAVVAANGDYTTAQVTESGNLYYTDARSRAALSFAAGSGAYNTSTGVITIPTNNNQITNGAGYITSAALAGYLPLTGGTLTGPLGGTSASFSGDVTANRYRGVNSLVLNTYTTVNPSSNVYLYSPPSDRDAWIYLDSADTGSNWGIYHRQIDSAVSGLPANSIGFIGGGSSILQSWISLANGNGYFAGSLTAANLSGTNTGNVTIGTANGLSLSGQTLSLGLASGSTNGALSSTDWTTFNNKQNALTNPVTGTGTTNYLPKFTGSTTIGNSQIFDNGTNVGIGTPSPSTLLQVFTNTSNAGRIRVTSTTSTAGNYRGYEFGNSLGFRGGIVQDESTEEISIFTPIGGNSVRISAIGNLGLGVTPSAWNAGGKAIEIGMVGSAHWGLDQTSTYRLTNAYWNSGWKYGGTGQAANYAQEAGNHYWSTAPSGTAGNAISFTQAMTLFSTGNLLVGSPSPISDNGARLQVSGDVTIINSDARLRGGDVTGRLVVGNSATSTYGIFYGSAHASIPNTIVFATNSAQALFIASNQAATFSSSVTAGGGFEIPNGQFYRARRTSGNLLTDMIGIPSGTDDVRVLTTGAFNIINGSLTTILGISNTGIATFSSGINATKTAKNTYAIHIRGGFFGAPRLQLYDLSVDPNAFVGLGVDMSGAPYEFSNYFPRTAGLGRWSVGSWAGDFGAGQYVSGYNEKFFIVESAAQFNTNLGIGVSPATNLHVQGASVSYGQIRFLNSSSSGEASMHIGRTNQTLEQRWTIGQGVAGIGDSFGFYTGGSSRFNITTGGNVLIGTTTDNGQRLQVDGETRLSGRTGINSNSVSGVVLSIKTENNGSLDFGLVIRNSSDTNLFRVRNDGGVIVANLGTGIVYSNGGILTSTNPSDFNLKENIVPINYGLDEILQLKPVTFNWKNDTINQGKQYGFIAQEVEKIMPDLVKKGEYLGLDKEGIFTTLVKAIQELKQEINTLKN